MRKTLFKVYFSITVYKLHQQLFLDPNVLLGNDFHNCIAIYTKRHLTNVTFASHICVLKSERQFPYPK